MTEFTYPNEHHVLTSTGFSVIKRDRREFVAAVCIEVDDNDETLVEHSEWTSRPQDISKILNRFRRDVRSVLLKGHIKGARLHVCPTRFADSSVKPLTEEVLVEN